MPDEVQAIYPHLDAVPEDVWLLLFGSAKREIGILAEGAQPVAGYPRVLDVLAKKAAATVSLRICLPDACGPAITQSSADQDDGGLVSAHSQQALSSLRTLRQKVHTEIRLQRVIAYNVIYYADDEFLVGQRVHGTPASAGPAIYLRRLKDGDMASIYLDSFANSWTHARVLDA